MTIHVAPARRSTGAAVEFAGVSRVFGSAHALDGLDLSINAGELIALLGAYPSCSGF